MLGSAGGIDHPKVFMQPGAPEKDLCPRKQVRIPLTALASLQFCLRSLSATPMSPMSPTSPTSPTSPATMRVPDTWDDPGGQVVIKQSPEPLEQSLQLGYQDNCLRASAPLWP